MSESNENARHVDAGTLTNSTQGYVNAYTGEVTAFSGADDLTAGMKTFYNTALLENARSNLVHSQFGRRQGLPEKNGKTIEWRKWNTLPRAVAPLTEGVIPTGQKLGQSTLSSSLSQHGMYVSVTDMLDLHNVDPVIAGAAEELGASAGETEDTLVRNELLKGTNVLYCDTVNSSGAVTGTPAYRWQLQQGNNRLTPDMVHQAAIELEKMKAPTIDGYYVAIIHPSVAYDLTKSEQWHECHQYAAATEIFKGEIGELYGVRFVRSTEAAVYAGEPLNGDTARYLTVAAYTASGSGAASAGVATTTQVTIDETPSEALIGRRILVQDITDNKVYGAATVKGINATSKYVFLDAPVSGVTPADGDYLLPGEGGLESQTGSVYSDTVNGKPCAVYCTLFMGRDAYGIIDPEGGGLEMIVKGRDQIGGPLNQFSTVGYKFEFGAKILYQDRIVRVESCSRYSTADGANGTSVKQ